MNKNNVFSSILNNKEIFDTQSLAVFQGSWTSSKSLVIYAVLLNFHPKFIEDIERLRDKYKIKSPYYYPEKRNMEEILMISRDFFVDQIPQIDNDVSELLKKYRLTDVWELPIKIKLRSNILPIPYDTGKIQFSFPREILNPNIEDQQKLPLVSLDVIDARKRASSPCLVLTEYVTPKNIYDFAMYHKDEIKAVLKHMPKRLFQDIDLYVLGIGIWIFIRKELKNRSWDEIDNEILEINETDPEFFGDPCPSRIECQKRLDDVKQHFRKIFPL